MEPNDTPSEITSTDPATGTEQPQSPLSPASPPSDAGSPSVPTPRPTIDAAAAAAAPVVAEPDATPVQISVHPTILERLHQLFNRLEAGAVGDVHTLRLEIKALRAHFHV